MKARRRRPGPFWAAMAAAEPATGVLTRPSGTHHYHLQVLALDTLLPLAAGANRGQFDRASRGRVIASGETIGLYSAPH